MEMGWKLLRVELLMMVLLTAAATTKPASATGNATLPGCKNNCGNISVPYPFGVGPGCFRQGFELTCNESAKPPQLLIDVDGKTILEVVDVSLSGQLRIKGPTAINCFDSAFRSISRNYYQIDISLTPFTFSHTLNSFIAVGCDTIANIASMENNKFMGGCMSSCTRSLDGVANGTCSGMGCCRTSIPRGLNAFMVGYMASSNSYRDAWPFNSCGCSFMVEESQYSFNTADLNDSSFCHRTFPIALDWSIGNQTCQQFQSGKLSDYACRSEHSECVGSNNGVGYLCNCSDGYAGNPYLDQGCQDIDECSDESRYPCKGICTNTPGNYTCSCPQGFSSPDPTRERCVPNGGSTLTLPAKLGIGFGAVFLSLLTSGSWAYWGFQKRKLLQKRHKFFQRNGGLFVQQHIDISSNRGGSSTFRIFTEDELAKASSNFDDSQILGRGGHGTVYKGTLDDGREVAIKRSKTVEERESKEFAREMLILSQINHKNIVKLLGCCLEVEVPMLVYEYVPNGTLFHCIHNKRQWHTIPLGARLRIAAEAAEALAYLHSYASPPILHGDVKSCNILLDGDYMAKVSDFGASILAPVDSEQLASVVQGTCGYLDPEYLVTCQMTDKSDVYSFGVVLLELITGKKAFEFDGLNANEKSLAMRFLSAFKEKRLAQILESHLVSNDDEIHVVLKEVAELAHKCLQLKGENRPMMEEVAQTLRGLNVSEEHPWQPHNRQEAESPLLEEPPTSNYISLVGTTSGYLSMRDQLDTLGVGVGR